MKRVLAAVALGAGLAACSAEPPTAPEAAAPAAALAHNDPLMSAVGIGVSDLQRSTDFYVNVMGMRKIRTYKLDSMDEELLAYPNGETYIVLMHWTDGSKRNYKDNPIKIVTRTKDPAALQEKIRAAGMEITREYAPSSQVGGSSVGLAKDPDGYVLEILPSRQAAAPSARVPDAVQPAAAPSSNP